MRRPISILAIALLVLGCGGPGAGGSAAPATNVPSRTAPATTSPAYDVGTGARDLIFRLNNDGGFVPPSYMLTHLPSVALYGDGRVIVQGPVIEIYPAPLLPNLRQMHVTSAEIQTILAAADADGLLGPDASYDATGIMDAGTSVFTTVVGGKTHRISAYALSESGTTSDAAAAAARKKLQDFQDKITDLSTFLGRTVSDAEAYAPTEMRVLIGPEPAADPNFPNPQLVTWPLTMSPKSGQPIKQQPNLVCLAISGPDLASFMKVAGGANALTVWSAPAGRFAVSVRPLYPEESGCEAMSS